MKERQKEIEKKIEELKKSEISNKKRKRKKRKRKRKKSVSSSSSGSDSSNSSSESSESEEEQEQKKKKNPDEILTDEEMEKKRKKKRKKKKKIKKSKQSKNKEIEESGSEIEIQAKEEDMLPESMVIERKVTKKEEEVSSVKPIIDEVTKYEGNDIIIRNINSDVESIESENEKNDEKEEIEVEEDLERVDIQRLEKEAEETMKANSKAKIGKSAISSLRKKRAKNFVKASIKFSVLGKSGSLSKSKNFGGLKENKSKKTAKEELSNFREETGWDFEGGKKKNYGYVEKNSKKKKNYGFVEKKKPKKKEVVVDEGDDGGWGNFGGGGGGKKKSFGAKEKDSGVGQRYNGENVKGEEDFNFDNGVDDDSDNSWDN